MFDHKTKKKGLFSSTFFIYYSYDQGLGLDDARLDKQNGTKAYECLFFSFRLVLLLY